MKRFACAVLILCMIPVCSFAIDLETFNGFAYAFDEPELEMDKAVVSDGYTIFESDGCRIAFKGIAGKDESIIVQGDGIPFIAYTVCAIMYFDPSSARFSDNAGQALSTFLLSRKGAESMGQIANGYSVYIQKEDNGYSALIWK